MPRSSAQTAQIVDNSINSSAAIFGHVEFSRSILSRKFTIRLEIFHILVYHITTGNHTKYIYEREAKSTPWASIDFSHRLYVFFEVPNSNSIKGDVLYGNCRHSSRIQRTAAARTGMAGLSEWERNLRGQPRRRAQVAQSEVSRARRSRIAAAPSRSRVNLWQMSRISQAF